MKPTAITLVALILLGCQQQQPVPSGKERDTVIECEVDNPEVWRAIQKALTDAGIKEPLLRIELPIAHSILTARITLKMKPGSLQPVSIAVFDNGRWKLRR